jgi:hypothetical protein
MDCSRVCLISLSLFQQFSRAFFLSRRYGFNCQSDPITFYAFENKECFNVGNSTINRSFQYNDLNISYFNALDCQAANFEGYGTFSTCLEDGDEGGRRDYLVSYSSKIFFSFFLVYF